MASSITQSTAEEAIRKTDLNLTIPTDVGSTPTRRRRACKKPVGFFIGDDVASAQQIEELCRRSSRPTHKKKSLSGKQRGSNRTMIRASSITSVGRPRDSQKQINFEPASALRRQNSKYQTEFDTIEIGPLPDVEGSLFMARARAISSTSKNAWLTFVSN